MDRVGTASIRGMVFVDVVGSTALRSRLGEVRADLLRRHHDELLGAVVDDHDGHVLRWTGDGMKASFASASAAIAAALDVQRAVARYGQRADAVAELQVRVGVSVGEVTTEDGDEHGVAVIEGARLEALAGAGEVLATDLVRRLGHRRVGADFEGLGPRQLKGLDEPVEVVRVIDTRADGSEVPLPKILAVDARFPLVGRTAASEDAGAAWREVKGGATATVLVGAAPGMGKSRLVAHVAETAHGDGALVLAGGCDSDLAVPYQPFTIAFDEVIGLDAELARAVADGTGPLGLLFPARSSARSTDGLGPSSRFELFQAVAELLERLSASQPVMLVLEDLHWATSATIHLIRHLVSQGGGARLLVVGTFRAEEVDELHPLHELLADVHRVASLSRIDLERLAPTDVEALVAGRVPVATPGDVREFSERVWEESSGSPFFVCEIIDHLSRTGELGRIVGRGGGAGLPVPDSVRDIVGHRIGRLPPGAADLLTSAALIGQTFDLGVLAEQGGIDPEQALLGIEAAERAALVHEVAAGRFAFVHAIVRTTIATRLSATRRALVHRRIAEAYEVLSPDDHDELAHQWLEALDEPRATEHLRQAANRDLEALAYESAVERFAQVLDHYARHTAPDARAEARVCLGLAIAERAAGQEAYLDHIIEAGRRARDLDDVETMVEAAIASLFPGTYFSALGPATMDLVALTEDALDRMDADDPRRVRVLSTLATHLGFRTDRARTLALLGEALDLARADGDPALIGSVLIAEHLTTWDPTTFDRRRVITEELIELAEGQGGADVEFFAGFFAALGALERCDVTEARRLAEELAGPMDRSRNLSHRFLGERVLVTLDILAGVPDVQARVDALAARYDTTHSDTTGTWALQTGSLAHEAGRLADFVPALRDMVEGSAIASIWRTPYGLALFEDGQRDAAMQILDTSDLPPVDYFWMTVLQTRAELAIGLGRTDVCRELYDALLPHGGLLGITASGSVVCGLVDGSLGRLALAVGDVDNAIERSEAAVAAAVAMGAPHETVRSRRGLAEALVASGRDPASPEVAELVAAGRTQAAAHGFRRELALLDAIGSP